MKLQVPFVKQARETRGSPYTKKNMSHGSFRAKRKPNSKRVKNGSVQPHVED